MTAASFHTIEPRHGAREAHRRPRPAALAALAGLAAFLLAQSAFAQVASRLEKIEVNPQPGEQIEVKLVLDGPAPQPVTFTIDNPARLSVDLPGTTLALPSRRVDVKSGGVDTIVAAEASGRSRLVFNLDSCGPTRRGSPATSCTSPSARAPTSRRRRRRSRRPRQHAQGGDGDVRAIDRKGGFPPWRRRGGAHPGHDQRSASAGQPEAGRRSHRDRLPGHGPARCVRASLRRRGFRDAGQHFRRHARAERRAHRGRGRGRLRAARLPVGPRLRARGTAAAQGRGRRSEQAGVQG